MTPKPRDGLDGKSQEKKHSKDVKETKDREIQVFVLFVQESGDS